MFTGIKVAGNIVGELSEKIPTHIVALNELIKNSYDAGAKSVYISLNTNEKKLVIVDDGCGMEYESIETLFHISNSNKKYGKINEYGRYTQGSKGLGFLSVFKFGDIVTWKTKKSVGLKFSADYKEIIQSSDISKQEIKILSDDSIAKGTQIEITLNDYALGSLQEYFSDESVYNKIIYSFIDTDLIIEIEINGKTFSNKKGIDIKSYVPERQMYYVKYNSTTQKIEYYYNDNLILSFSYPFSAQTYKLELELQIFQLKKTQGKDNINKLFFNPQGELTPLVYINSNLFNNYNIFDPALMRPIKNGWSLPQMIGYIKIITDDERVNFNSDRTQFLQNEVTDEIIQFLKDINYFIQKEGSLNKKHLVELDFLKEDMLKRSELEGKEVEIAKSLIKDTFQFRDQVKIEITQNNIIYSIFGKTKKVIIKDDKSNQDVLNNTSSDNEKNRHSAVLDNSLNKDEGINNLEVIQPAVIQINNKKNKRISIPSKQIDLYGYLEKATDSRGNLIDFRQIKIIVDKEEIKNGILPSVDSESSKNVQYYYEDLDTGVLIECITLNFYQPRAVIKAEKNEGILLTLPTNKQYSISFNGAISSLINQINSLDIKEYKELISCSLRSLFEISIDCIRKSEKFPLLFFEKNNKGKDVENSELAKQVEMVAEYIKRNPKFIGVIATATKIDFNSLKNRIDPSIFRKAVETSNLGAHKANTYMTENDIRHLAHIAAIFVVIVNEMLNSQQIN